MRGCGNATAPFGNILTFQTRSSNLITSGAVYTYAPKKDGTGATGTWGINISGSAKTWSTEVPFSISKTANNNNTVNINGDETSVTLQLPTELEGLSSVTATSFKGIADKALCLTDASGEGLTAGDANTPIYFENGIPKTITGDITLDVKVDNAVASDRWSKSLTFKIASQASSAGTAVYGPYDTNGSAVNEVSLSLPTEITGISSLAATTIEATTFKGALDGNAKTATNATNAENATTASKLGTADIGSTTIPIYLDNGVPKACESISLNAATATKWASKMTLKLSGTASTTSNPTSVSFNGEEGTNGVTLNMPKAITGFTEVSSAKVTLNEGTTNRMYFQYNATNESCEFVFV